MPGVPGVDFSGMKQRSHEGSFFRRLDFLPPWLAWLVGLLLGGGVGALVALRPSISSGIALVLFLGVAAALVLTAEPVAVPEEIGKGRGWRSEPAWKVGLAAGLVLLFVGMVGYQFRFIRQSSDSAPLIASSSPDTPLPPPPELLPPAHPPGTLWTDPGIGMRFRYIPAGTFQMGSPPDEPGRDDNETRHEVTLTRCYWLGVTEVTQGQWRQVMGNNPSRFQECGNDCPVEQVNWYEAVAFANALSRRASLAECYQLKDCQKQPGEGMECSEVKFAGPDCGGYRLPTEAEWERAARAGTETALYTGPITIEENRSPQLDPIAWYGSNSGGQTHPVGQKMANAWQLNDMLGNVWEWCNDWNGAYLTTTVLDPQGPDRGSHRVIRGGSWSLHARRVRGACRGWGVPGYRYGFLGFRLARGQGPSEPD